MLEKGKICFSYSPIDSQHGGFTNVFSQRTQAVHHGSAFGGFLNGATPNHPQVMNDHDLVLKPMGNDWGTPF